MFTDESDPATCALVTIASGATKNPLPRPFDVSTRTTAGMTRPMTSSSGAGPASCAAAAGTALPRAAPIDSAPAGSAIGAPGGTAAVVDVVRSPGASLPERPGVESLVAVVAGRADAV